MFQGWDGDARRRRSLTSRAGVTGVIFRDEKRDEKREKKKCELKKSAHSNTYLYTDPKFTRFLEWEAPRFFRKKGNRQVSYSERLEKLAKGARQVQHYYWLACGIWGCGFIYRAHRIQTNRVRQERKIPHRYWSKKTTFLQWEATIPPKIFEDKGIRQVSCSTRLNTHKKSDAAIGPKLK
jgi:hypothetical protein